MRTNTRQKAGQIFTHEGGKANHASKLQQLRRSVMSCMLFEREFYESGHSIAERIQKLADEVSLNDVAALAIEARSKMNLRHAPLLLLLSLIKNGRGMEGNLVSNTIAEVIQRPDEIAELVALYWSAGKKPLSKQLKRGLAKAFNKFDAYQIAKYNRRDSIQLRDVMFLTHPKPDEPHIEVLNKLANKTLESPDTWEVALSGGANKNEVFTRLLSEGKLPYMALLRNLRNMDQAGVDHQLVKDAIVARKGARRILPFRYVAAARAAPRYEPALDKALLASISDTPSLRGATSILVDVSASMDWNIASKSDMKRIDAAAAIACLANADDLRVFTFSDRIEEVPPRRGMSGVDVVIKSQLHRGTHLAGAVKALNDAVKYDRLIIITDEQAHDDLGSAKDGTHSYIINVGSYQNGIGYGKGWVHIDGMSDRVFEYIHEYEAENF